MYVFKRNPYLYYTINYLAENVTKNFDVFKSFLSNYFKDCNCS